MLILTFWATFSGKMDVATMRTLIGFGPQNTTKKLEELLGQLHYLEKVFLKISGLKTPPLNVMWTIVHIINNCLQ